MPVSIHVERIHEFLARSLIKVFQTMLSADCSLESADAYSGKQAFSPQIDPSRDNSTRIFASSVGFAGEINGVCYLFLGDKFAYSAANRITGLDMAELDDETVRDVCGELTNMFAGTFKNCLADLGLPSTLTVPTVVQGKRMAISTAGTADQFRFTFSANSYPIFADLLLSGRR